MKSNATMDWTRFKKVKSDDKTTTLKHPKGHEIRIVHASLSHKMRKGLEALPMQKSVAEAEDADDAQPNNPKLAESKKTIRPAAVPKAPKMMAEGGEAAPGEARDASDETALPAPTGVTGPTGGPAPITEGVQGPTGEVPQPQPSAPTPDSTDQAATPTPNQMPEQPPAGDPFGTNAQEKYTLQGLGEQKLGIEGQARAEGNLGQAEAKSIENNLKQQREIQNNYQTHFSQLEQERQALQEDVKNGHIDPNHYFASKDTGGKIATAIGLILGGIGSGMSGQPNLALQVLQKNIERDMEAQKAELGKKENLLSANMRQFGNLHDATRVTMAMQSDIMSAELKKAAAQAQDPIAKARALQAAGQLDAQAAPIMAQVAMRKTILGGMNSGQIQPEAVVRMLVPEHEKPAAYKELQQAQGMVKARDNLLASFDKLNKINTVGNRVMNPIQSARQAAAIRDPLVAGLSKETAGRFTEQDAGMLAALFPRPGEDAQTVALKKAQMDKLISEKMNFPLLQSYGIHPAQFSRFGQSGVPRIPESAPQLPKRR